MATFRRPLGNWGQQQQPFGDIGRARVQQNQQRDPRYIGPPLQQQQAGGGLTGNVGGGAASVGNTQVRGAVGPQAGGGGVGAQPWQPAGGGIFGGLLSGPAPQQGSGGQQPQSIDSLSGRRQAVQDGGYIMGIGGGSGGAPPPGGGPPGTGGALYAPGTPDWYMGLFPDTGPFGGGTTGHPDYATQLPGYGTDWLPMTGGGGGGGGGLPVTGGGGVPYPGSGGFDDPLGPQGLRGGGGGGAPQSGMPFIGREDYIGGGYGNDQQYDQFLGNYNQWSDAQSSIGSLTGGGGTGGGGVMYQDENGNWIATQSWLDNGYLGPPSRIGGGTDAGGGAPLGGGVQAGGGGGGWTMVNGGWRNNQTGQVLSNNSEDPNWIGGPMGQGFRDWNYGLPQGYRGGPGTGGGGTGGGGGTPRPSPYVGPPLQIDGGGGVGGMSDQELFDLFFGQYGGGWPVADTVTPPSVEYGLPAPIDDNDSVWGLPTEDMGPQQGFGVTPPPAATLPNPSAASDDWMWGVNGNGYDPTFLNQLPYTPVYDPNQNTLNPPRGYTNSSGQTWNGSEWVTGGRPSGGGGGGLFDEMFAGAGGDGASAFDIGSIFGGNLNVPIEPVLTSQQIQQLVNDAIGGNIALEHGARRRAREGFAGRGLQSDSPGIQGVDNRLNLNRAIADTQARTQIPIEAARLNADYTTNALEALSRQRGLDIGAFTALQNAQTGAISPFLSALVALMA